MSTLEILKAARQLLSDQERWTQGDYAKDENGATVDPVHPSATCFCSLGALSKVTGKSMMDAIEPKAFIDFDNARRALRKGTDLSIVTNNDLGSRDDAHRRVLKMFDKAIELEAVK